MTPAPSSQTPVIDLFAGPGGLGEGFAGYERRGRRPFRIALSIEKDPVAHRTLELRAFFRQFPPGEVPEDYYRFVRGETSREELEGAHPAAWASARHEALLAELGGAGHSREEIVMKIRRVAPSGKPWVLLGGPPCQAYSVVGRSRNRGVVGYVPEEDPRQYLYREYLWILAECGPAVFVMENVKGLGSARLHGVPLFDRLLGDLRDPRAALGTSGPGRARPRYILASLVHPEPQRPDDFTVRMEDFGIPQRRHRIIIIGVRKGLEGGLPRLISQPQVRAGSVLDGLPRLRSAVSRSGGTWEEWADQIAAAPVEAWAREARRDLFDSLAAGSGSAGQFIARARQVMAQVNVSRGLTTGGEWLEGAPGCVYRPDWFLDGRLGGVCNHSARSHMDTDLWRYLFASVYAELFGRSPQLADFPEDLLPAHSSARPADGAPRFTDRFFVQPRDQPSRTVLAHFGKDGHYAIHYDPTQCRSLTVREAARLQTFPDNYFFCGPRTQQFIQVGNAVPPLLAHQIAAVIDEFLQGVGL